MHKNLSPSQRLVANRSHFFVSQRQWAQIRPITWRLDALIMAGLERPGRTPPRRPWTSRLWLSEAPAVIATDGTENQATFAADGTNDQLAVTIAGKAGKTIETRVMVTGAILSL